MFYNKRQSRDIEVPKRILALIKKRKLCTDVYSGKLLEEASKERMLLEWWNRRYPYNECFPMELLRGMTKTAEEKCSGGSHEKTTMEVYAG